jgi:membrane fusion protein, macrolide-specific efflux system
MKGLWKVLAAVILVAAGAAVVVVKKRSAPAQESRIVRAERGDISATIQATGVVEPQNRVEIKPPIAGRAEEILVREGESVRKGQVVAWMSSSERAALVDAARAKGAEELRHWEELYKPAPLVAPLSGVVIARKVEPGQTLTAQDAVLVMSNRLIVKAQVDETDIGKVRLRQPATIVLDAFAEEPISGTVDHIAFEAKTVNNVTIYEVQVAPERVPEFMRSGMTANVLFLIGEKKDVVTVPSDAVQLGDNGLFVLLPTEKGRPERRPVTTGLSNGKQTEITSGLSDGDTLLVRSVRFSERAAGSSNPFSPFGRRRSGGNRAGGGGSRAH